MACPAVAQSAKAGLCLAKSPSTMVEKTLEAIIFLSLISPPLWAQNEHPWRVGLQTGYSTLGNLHVVSLKNAFPVTGILTYEWSEKWNTKFEYQWIKTEHAPGNNVFFQTLSIVPGYKWLSFQEHDFSIESGLGYQFINLKGIDKIRQIEWLVGPTWSWNFLDNWSVDGSFRYCRSFDSFFNSSFQHIDILIGLSFAFGEKNKHAEITFTDADQDGVDNKMDECSATPFGIKVAKNGCPLDQDGDSIVDYNDFCSGTKFGIEVDEIGCPLTHTGRGTIDGIGFERNSPRLTATSKNELFLVAENLKKFPDLFYIIEGYSSSESDVMDQIAISRARAVSVMNILVSYGVPSNKMRAVGFGNQYPLTDSTNRNDQILNERIEIKWKHEL